MRKKTFHFFFWLCLIVVLGVMGWLSFSVWKLENRREQELSLTRLEETTRLALWRMDSLVATLWADENGRAPQEYFFITEKKTNRQSPLFRQAPEYVRLYFQIDSEGGFSSPQIPDSKDQKGTESFRKNYEFLASSDIPEKLKKMADTSSRTEVSLPRLVDQERVVMERAAPAASSVVKKEMDNLRQNKKEEERKDLSIREQRLEQTAQAVMDYNSRSNFSKSNTAAVARQELQAEDSPFVNEEKSLLKKVKRKVSPESLSKADFSKSRKNAPSRKAEESSAKVLESAVAVREKKDKVKLPADTVSHKGLLGNRGAALDDFQLRVGRSGDSILSVEKGFDPAGLDSIVEEPVPEPSLAENSLAVSAFVPHWVNGDLFLLRTVTHASRKYVQGIWVDWNKMNDLLTSSIADLLPDARLFPLTGGEVTEANISRTLAGLPILIDPGKLPVFPQDKGISTLELSLAVAWFFALAAAAGVSFLLWGMVRLSERRATFVSAVTHELRTPLTTFNLYTEMLTEGLVPENKRLSYFATLRQEALRLTHLVDNVLSFSRLEKSRPLRHPERIRVTGLKDAVLRHIQPRLEGAGMGVQAEISPEDAEREIHTDVTAVEQIMYNLADNAAKYAAVKGGMASWRLRVEGKNLVMSFQDEGKGIPEALRKRLFRPFSRSAEEAAGKKPGVGLGLALSREIARDLGGDLKWVETDGKGACFVLTLPLGE